MIASFLYLLVLFGVLFAPPTTARQIPEEAAKELARETQETHKMPIKVGQQIPEVADKQNSQESKEMGSLVVAVSIFAALLLILTGATIAAEIWVMNKRGKGWDDWNSFRIVVITLVVSVGGFLVVVGYSSGQLAAIMGLMGAIVGYMFGKGEPEKKPAEPGPAGGGQAGP
jgi:uncharacterized BrkB/YihY/UPF0761 family membrane protein